MTDEFVFAPEVDEQPPVDGMPANAPWKVAIIDDDESVHKVTKVALSNFNFDGDGLEFIHGYSGEEAKKIFAEHDDIAVVLLDVVMEEDHSGLEVVKFIREDLKNKNTRIVLRTGQPGQAPEREVITEYDINDYKEKTELTARKLYTLIYSCLRSYRDIVALNESRQGLERVINASKNIFERQFLDEFALGVLQQLTSILGVDRDAFIGQLASLAAHEDDDGFKVVAGTGMFNNAIGQDVLEHLPLGFRGMIQKGTNHDAMHDKGSYLAIAKGQNGKKNIIYLTGLHRRRDLDMYLIDLFCQNVLIAFDNLSLREQILDTQREIVCRLGEAVEKRSEEMGNHVKRVAEISKLLALKYGLPPAQAEILKHTSPMHDLGKIGIPDAILNKPGKLDDDEWELMKAHSMMGYNMLNTSRREILKLGAILALEHHEKWDGSGYPDGKAGDDISIEARITAVADVFDALSSNRSYKEAWPREEVYTYMREQKGRHFDPGLIDIFFEHTEEVEQICKRYADIP